MSAMTEMMTKKIFLEVCMGIEGLCADVYHYYSKIYGDIPEAAVLWKKAALEEENHQRQFGLALRLLYETEFGVSKVSLKRAYDIQSKLLKLIDHVKDNKPELLAAVSEAVELEEDIAELHAYNALDFKAESLRNLFKLLSESDRDHIDALQRYRSTLSDPTVIWNADH